MVYWVINSTHSPVVVIWQPSVGLRFLNAQFNCTNAVWRLRFLQEISYSQHFVVTSFAKSDRGNYKQESADEHCVTVVMTTMNSNSSQRR
jgi:hypothetical protein